MRVRSLPFTVLIVIRNSLEQIQKIKCTCFFTLGSGRLIDTCCGVPVLQRLQSGICHADVTCVGLADCGTDQREGTCSSFVNR